MKYIQFFFFPETEQMVPQKIKKFDLAKMDLVAELKAHA